MFAAASTLAGRIAPAALAAHQIVLNIVAFIFMVPLGFSSAAAVRVGHAVGGGIRAGARTSGWIALVLATVRHVHVCDAVCDGARVARRGSSRRTPDVMRIGVGLLLVAAVFQLFDGMQAVATGALRGLGNTRTPMFVNLVGHWLIGLPLAYTLCFPLRLGRAGPVDGPGLRAHRDGSRAAGRVAPTQSPVGL